MINIKNPLPEDPMTLIWRHRDFIYNKATIIHNGNETIIVKKAKEKDKSFFYRLEKEAQAIFDAAVEKENTVVLIETD